MAVTLEQKIKKLPLIQKYFYDFYLSSHLWWTYGSGKSEYGFEQTNILSYDKENKLNEFCVSKIKETKQKVLKELYYCITREGRHATKWQGCKDFEFREKFFVNFRQNFKSWYLTNGILVYPNFSIIKNKDKSVQLKYANLSLTQKQYISLIIFSIPEYGLTLRKFIEGMVISFSEQKKLFKNFKDILDKIMYDKNCLHYNTESFFSYFLTNIFENNAHEYYGIQDAPSTDQKQQEMCPHTINILYKWFSCYRLWNCYYGGRKWAKACKMWFELYNSKTLKNDIFIIDKIFDLQHNTGIIFSKKGCELNGLTKTHLDKRSNFRHNKEFFPFISLKAKKHCLNYSNL
jgi:hypothetical protein